MSDTKWTPGPWVVVDGSLTGNISVNSVDGDYYVATTHGWAGIDSDDDTCAANSHLIAAAPELYEALHNAVASGLPEVVRQEAVAALRKARGEA